MSSVGSSDSSNAASRNEESVRRSREREEAKKKEMELAKKQTREVRRLRETHNDEIEKLKTDHEAQLDNLKDRAMTDINERDHKYQQDMAEMRDLYKKQLQEQAENDAQQEAALRKATSGDMKAMKATHAEKEKAAQNAFAKNLQQRDDRIQGALEELRQGQKAAIDENREKLTRHYEAQTEAMQEEHNQKVSDLTKDFGNYRRETQESKRDQDIRHMQAQRRASENLIRSVNKERKSSDESRKLMQEGFEDARLDGQERFERAMQKERQVSEVSRNNLKNTVSDRIENQVNRLEHDNRDLRDENVLNNAKVQIQKRREINNMAKAFQKNVEAYKNERDEIIRQAKEDHQSDIDKIQDQNSKLTVAANRGYRQKQEQSDQIHRAAFENLKGDFDSRFAQNKMQTEKRVKNLLDATLDDKVRSVKVEQENRAASQMVKQDEMRNMRAAMMDDKNAALAVLRDRLQKQELQHTEKMNAVVQKYEKQLTTMKDQMIKEKKASDDNLKRVTEELQRANKLNLDQVVSQNREQLRQTNQHHSEEIRQMNKQNEEKLDQLISEYKRT